MNIQEAKNTLTELIAKKTAELESFKLSLDILNEVFKPDLSALEQAQADADKERMRANSASQQVDSLTGEMNAKLAENERLSIENESLKAENITLKADPVEEALPADVLPKEIL